MKIGDIKNFSILNYTFSEEIERYKKIIIFMMDFVLSSKLLSQVKEAGFADDFEFKIFDSSIFCNKFVAVFISKLIMQYYRNDPTIRKFEINFPANSVFYSNIEELKSMIQRTNFIKQFENILVGQSISITQNENDQEFAKLIIETGQILKNDEMVEKGLQIIGIGTNKSDITIEKAFKIIKTSKFTSPQMVEYACDIISSNFHSIISENEKGKFISLLKELRKSEIEMIISSKKLLIESEDSLFDFITEMGSEYSFLYDYVEIQCLSVEKIEKLIEFVSNYEISLHPLLWSSICRRLMIDVSKITNNCDKNRYIKPKVAVICENGVFKYLESLSNSNNVYLSKIVDVDVPNISSGAIENIFDHSKNTYIYVGSYTEYQKNSYIIVDFKDKQINLSKYYFSVTSTSGVVRNRPKSWEIEGSNDKDKWYKIDEKSNELSLNNYGASNTFSVKSNSEYYRYIKIKEIQGTDNGHEIMLSEIEFFGSIISN